MKRFNNVYKKVFSFFCEFKSHNSDEFKVIFFTFPIAFCYKRYTTFRPVNFCRFQVKKLTILHFLVNL